MIDNKRFNSNIKLIAFDADDTLWVNEYHYRKAEERFAELMSPWCNYEQANNTLLRVEKENLPLLGYGSKPFIISLIESGIEISKGELTNEQILKLIKIGKETIGQNIELYPNAEEILSKLSGHYPLLLATKGDLKEQESKIERSGLKRYFSHIEIMSEKNRDSYISIIENQKIRPENFLMIGNSFKSDILPVLEIGGNAIYIPSDITWAHEVVEERDHPNLVRAESLDMVTRFFNINK
jgi:putative hydrolase of the HAD superfamily